MTVRELVEQLAGANPDATLELLDVSGRGMKFAITDGVWAVQVAPDTVFIRIDDARTVEGRDGV